MSKRKMKKKSKGRGEIKRTRKNEKDTNGRERC